MKSELELRLRFHAGALSCGNKLILKLYNFLRLITLDALRHDEFNVIAFVEGFKSASLNCGMMHENIVSGIAPDKTITFFVIEPLYYALFFHFTSLLIRNCMKINCADSAGFLPEGKEAEL